MARVEEIVREDLAEGFGDKFVCRPDMGHPLAISKVFPDDRDANSCGY